MYQQPGAPHVIDVIHAAHAVHVGMMLVTPIVVGINNFISF